MLFLQCLEGGGAEKVAVDILNNIDKKKYDVTLVLLFGNGLYIERLNPEIKVKSIINKPKGKIVKKILYLFIKYFPRVFYYLFMPKNFNIEIAFLEGFSTKIISYSTNKKSKKIAWIHTDLSKYQWTCYAYKKNEENKCYKRFDDVIFVSNVACIGFDKIFRIDNIRKHIINNPLFIENIIDQSNKMEIIYNDFTIISVGRLIDIKGFDRLIEAHAKLVKKYYHKLIIIGEGEQREYLIKLISLLEVKKSVSLIGFKENPYVYVKAANLFVSSSKCEGFPIALAEAIILGKPILITDILGSREVLGGEEFGIICDNSTEGIEKGLESILKDKDLLKYYEKKSLERRNFFENDTIILKIQKILDEI